MCMIPFNLVVLIVMKSNIDIGEIQCLQKVKVVISIPKMNKQVNKEKMITTFAISARLNHYITYIRVSDVHLSLPSPVEFHLNICFA